MARYFYCCGIAPVGWCSTNCIPFARCAHGVIKCDKCGLRGTEAVLDCHVCVDDEPDE